MAQFYKIAFTVAAVMCASVASPGDILLSVSGTTSFSASRETPDDAREIAVFDMEALKSLPVTRFETSTIWTDGVLEFTGVSLHDLFQEIDIPSDIIRAVALNNYAVDIPVSDAIEGGPILAYHLNGEPMSVRDRGPLWIVYPYDSNPDYRSEDYYSRSIWQLRRIEIPVVQ